MPVTRELVVGFGIPLLPSRISPQIAGQDLTTYATHEL